MTDREPLSRQRGQNHLTPVEYTFTTENFSHFIPIKHIQVGEKSNYETSLRVAKILYENNLKTYLLHL